MEFGTITIIGGGCYGSYYLRQLERGSAAGAVAWRRVVIVDRDPGCAVATGLARRGDTRSALQFVAGDWHEYLGRELSALSDSGGDASGDAIVPSPLMPHLLFEWLVQRARDRWPDRTIDPVPVEQGFGLPWESLAPGGTRYLSYADWTCPINCIEPARCPHTREPRDWSMPVALRSRIGVLDREAAAEGVIAFHCTHRVYGVGMVDVADVIAADRLIARRAGDGALKVYIGTTSHCHGALAAFQVGVPRVPDGA